MDGRGTFTPGACAPPQRVLEDAISPSTIRLKQASTIAEIRIRVPERDRVIMREHAQTLAQGYVDSRGVLRKLLLGKDIVFAVNKRHAETLAALFGAQFARFRPSPAKRFADDAVASDHGAVSEVDDMTKIRRFKKGTVTALMANAFDAPEPQCSTR